MKVTGYTAIPTWGKKMKTKDGFFEDDMNIIVEAIAYQIDFDNSLNKQDLKKRYAIIKVIENMVERDKKYNELLDRYKDNWD